MSTSTPPSTTLNIPQLAVLIVIGFLAVRWFVKPSASTDPNNNTSSSSSSSTSSSRNGPTSARQLRQLADQADAVLAAFPLADRRAVMWDLQRNGGDLQRTVDRLLRTNGVLDAPPQSFQPAVAPSAPAAAAPSPAAPSAAAVAPTTPDLITRYKLHSRLSTPDTQTDSGSEADSTASGKGAWSTSKTERQSALQKRREEMILAARRKLVEGEVRKDKGKGRAV